MLLYRLLMSLVALVVLTRALLRSDITALRQRLALGPIVPGAHLWLHAASNGELTSARPVIDALREARPDLPLLITCNSQSGVDLAKGWGLTARLAPLDLAWVARRMHRRWQTCGYILMESELLAHRILTSPGPVMVLGGRLSAGTARGWQRFGNLQRRALTRINWLSAQDTGSLERFRKAGLSAQAEAPVADLKALYTPPAMRDCSLDALPRAKTWLAASTHEGEDEIVLAAHLTARKSEPDLRLILAPRHPRRADAIETLIRASGLSLARRSRGEAPLAEVYLADTLGEMPLFYAAAGRVLVCGSLMAHGGHTPYEPAAFGAAVLHGPHLDNFRAAYARLDAAQPARPLPDAPAIAAALVALADPKAQVEAGARTQGALAPEADARSLVRMILGGMDG